MLRLKRESFASRIGFLLVSAGCAIGIGNVWRFPTVTGQYGGGVFVLFYLLFLVLMGAPVLTMELAVGRAGHGSAGTAYRALEPKGSKWHLHGWACLIGCCVLMMYYTTVSGWMLAYFFRFVKGTFTGLAADAVSGVYADLLADPFEQIVWMAITVLLGFFVCSRGLQNGIERIGKWMMGALFVLILVLAVHSFVLPGAGEGLAFYLKPDFSGITFKSVLVAMGQAFYSLSLGMGIMITYGSYTGKEVNLVRSTAMVCVFDTVVALLAGLAIFPSVAHFDPSLLGSSKGVALMFIILPQVFESMGSVGQVVSFAFFVMVDIAAITSVVSLIEVVTQFVIQKFHVHRKRAALVVACVCFVVSIPIGISLGHVAILEESSPALFGLDWLTFFDEVTNTVLMPVCALFSCIVVGWFITPKRAVAEIEAEGTHMAGWLKKVYAVMIRFVTPALILIVEIGGLQSEIAAGNTAVIVFAYALVALCVVAYFAFFRNRDTGTNADEKLSGDYPV